MTDWHCEDLSLADCADVPYKVLGAAENMQQRRDQGDWANQDKPTGEAEVAPLKKLLGGTRGHKDNTAS
jgi:hypothetical protein